MFLIHKKDEKQTLKNYRSISFFVLLGKFLRGCYIKKKNFKITLWPLFMDGVQLPQA